MPRESVILALRKRSASRERVRGWRAQEHREGAGEGADAHVL
jgi:hypothetical protein